MRIVQSHQEVPRVIHAQIPRYYNIFPRQINFVMTETLAWYPYPIYDIASHEQYGANSSKKRAGNSRICPGLDDQIAAAMGVR